MDQDRAVLEARIRAHLEAGELAEAATQALQAYGAEILGYLVSVLRNKSAASDVFADFSEDLWTRRLPQAQQLQDVGLQAGVECGPDGV